MFLSDVCFIALAEGMNTKENVEIGFPFQSSTGIIPELFS
jgi:hypothetical protein